PSKFTWRTGLLYEAPIGLSPYVSYSTSFLPTLSTNLAGDPLKPTTGQQVEAGVEAQIARIIKAGITSDQLEKARTR
ncbi:TonB-dependent receptor, partial [Mycobacterium tuberculosis]|nr:TonB-dependent receptor [Mycobacterium tuberculosis]